MLDYLIEKNTWLNWISLIQLFLNASASYMPNLPTRNDAIWLKWLALIDVEELKEACTSFLAKPNYNIKQ